MTERIENIKIRDLVPFENHPFKTRSGIEQEELSESIKSGGLLTPIIARPFSDGKCEIISGHRRVEVCRELGLETIPAIVKELTNEEAVIAMVDCPNTSRAKGTCTYGILAEQRFEQRRQENATQSLPLVQDHNTENIISTGVLR